jgi:hypothetical protein
LGCVVPDGGSFELEVCVGPNFLSFRTARENEAKDGEAALASPSFLDFVDSLLGAAGALCSGRNPEPRSSSRLRNSDQEQGVCARRWDACDLSGKIRIARRAKRYLIGVVG